MIKYIIFISAVLISCQSSSQKKEDHQFPVTKTEAQWKKILEPDEYYILRQKGTERAFSSKLNSVDVAGVFTCAACGNELYLTENKFESGTGWPSFDRPVSEDNVMYFPDRTGGFPATEVVCANCGGHLGHVFNDGPRKTTGKRHCINGDALDFKPSNS